MKNERTRDKREKPLRLNQFSLDFEWKNIYESIKSWDFFRFFFLSFPFFIHAH